MRDTLFIIRIVAVSLWLGGSDEVGTREACLRVEPTRNGQRRGIRFVGDYQIHPPG